MKRLPLFALLHKNAKSCGSNALCVTIYIMAHTIQWKAIGDLMHRIFQAFSRTKGDFFKNVVQFIQKRNIKLSFCKKCIYTTSVRKCYNTNSKVKNHYEKKGECNMYIGTEIKNRMRMFDMNIEKFVYATMLDSDYIAGVLDNRIPLSEIDEFDLNVIAAVLYCEPEYFYCKENRERDVVYSSSNRGDDTSKSRLAKARIQKLIRDILFLKEVTKR